MGKAGWPQPMVKVHRKKVLAEFLLCKNYDKTWCLVVIPANIKSGRNPGNDLDLLRSRDQFDSILLARLILLHPTGGFG